MRVLTAITILALACPVFAASNRPNPDVLVRMVITIGHTHGRALLPLTRDDLTIVMHYDLLPIVNLAPLRADENPLDLYILVDSCSSCDPGSKFEELHRFILSQSPTTSIGLAYILDGHLRIAEAPTTDRERAVKALNIPAGSKPSDPFSALAELAGQWKATSSRHAVVMISDGINPNTRGDLEDPLAEAAIEAAQRSQTTVFTIYHPSADYREAHPLAIYSGQVQLAHVAAETGGEAYFINEGPLATLATFLSDISVHLSNQYVIEFLTKDAGGAAALESVTIEPKDTNIEVMAPYKVWVAGDSAFVGKW